MTQTQGTIAQTMLTALILVTLVVSGCAQMPDTDLRQTGIGTNGGQPLSLGEQTITPRPIRPLVAIAGFENRSTYASDKLWDTSAQVLSKHLLQMGYFRVVEWMRMKELFGWRELSHLDIVKSPENLQKARKILLCQYFISGAVTYFDVSQESNTSAISKKKVINTSIGVDLVFQDSVSGEYICSGTGAWTERQVFSNGKLGTWDPRAADKALNNAIEQALYRLTAKFDKKVATSPTVPEVASNDFGPDDLSLPPGCRVSLNRGKVVVLMDEQYLDEDGKNVPLRGVPPSVAEMTELLVKEGVRVVDYQQAWQNASAKAKRMLLAGRYKEAIAIAGNIGARFLLAGRVLSRTDSISQFKTNVKSFDVTIDLRLIDRSTAALLGAALVTSNVTGVDQFSATADLIQRLSPKLWYKLAHTVCASVMLPINQDQKLR